MVQLSHPYLTTGKTIALTIWIFVTKVLSLFFNMLSRFVIAFLPRSKHLLISWLQLLSIVILKVKVTVTQSCPTLCSPMDCSSPRLRCPWNSPGKNTGVGSCSLLQRIFPTQGLNPGLLHCRQILYYLSHQGSPRIAYPFSKGTCWPRKQTRVSCIAGRFFTSGAIREAHDFLAQENKICHCFYFYPSVCHEVMGSGGGVQWAHFC